MKTVFAIVAIFTLGVTGVVAYKRTNANTSGRSDQVNVQSHSVGGNITEDLKQTPESSFTLLIKPL